MGLSVLFLIALFGKTFYVQVIPHQGLQQQATTSTSLHHIGRPPGTIFDRNGEALAISRSMASIYATRIT